MGGGGVPAPHRLRHLPFALGFSFLPAWPLPQRLSLRLLPSLPSVYQDSRHQSWSSTAQSQSKDAANFSLLGTEKATVRWGMGNPFPWTLQPWDKKGGLGCVLGCSWHWRRDQSLVNL